ncbi:molybdenum cofactor guanylyltransferase [Thalassotalea profundi]|uniref:Molybdenum cofactor guanylyltransferase n=1 Tax=Thalassotalea profundi TaxID=2036687 RepID=A0ABQ3IWC7_9GAMM|nr:NTP transferase domain-containing protein [Thalassotalea profundi]GHE94745.1 molybdenum cofactor guanylyltransferase [Thalassotalea profundi]
MQKTLGVVLAGGLSSRMKQDKATLQRNHETMLDFSQSILKQCGVDDIVISGSNYQIKDLFQHLGPLSGIFSVIEQCPATALLILPIDLPLLKANTLKQLKIVGEVSQKACSYENHPLPLYLPVNSFVELFLQKSLSTTSGKGPSIRQLVKAIPHKTIAAPNTNCLFNTNTPEQWKHAQRSFIRE